MKSISAIEMSQDDADATRLAEFIERLAPLSKKYAKSSAEESYFGVSKASALDRKMDLLNHIFSLTDDGAFLTRVRAAHEADLLSHEARKQAYRAESEHDAPVLENQTLCL